MDATRPVLVAGVPRSGTTWTAQALAHCEDAAYIHEPDNHAHTAYALRAKRGSGTFPCLRRGESARAYARLWDLAFRGAGPRKGRIQRYVDGLLEGSSVPERDLVVTPGARVPFEHRLASALAPAPVAPRERPRVTIVKSVQVLLALEWLVERFDIRVLLVERHPLNVASSWLSMGWQELGELTPAAREYSASRWGVEPPDGRAPLVRRVAWRVGLYTAAVEEFARTYPACLHRTHESLCADPLRSLQEVAESLDLTWTDAATHYVLESNRQGEGYDTHRVAHRQSARWRTRLSDGQAAAILDELSGFPLALTAREFTHRSQEPSRQ